MFCFKYQDQDENCGQMVVEGIELIWNLEERGQELYCLYFFTLFSNEVSDRTNYIVAVWMPIIADNYSRQMFHWREKEFFLQTAGENATVEQTIVT